MPNRLNSAGVAFARSLIRQGAINQAGSWSFPARAGNRLLGADDDDWSTYGKHHLGINPDAGEQTKGRYKYPFAKRVGARSILYRRALAAIRQRSSQMGDTEIHDAAGRLMDSLPERRSGMVELEDGSFLVVKGAPEPQHKVEGDGRLVAIVSSESEDADNDIIRQGKNKRGRGWVLDRFNRHPVITWSHNIRQPSLSAPTTKAKIVRDEKLGRVLVLDPAAFDAEDAFAQEIEGKLRRRSVSEWSVGFKGMIVEQRRNDQAEPIMGFEFFEQELIEVAVANRGANFDTATLVKNLLGRDGNVQNAQAGDDAEVQELKDELLELDQNLRQAQNLLVKQGERMAEIEGRLKILDQFEKLQKDRAAALGRVYERLQEVGTAR